MLLRGLISDFISCIIDCSLFSYGMWVYEQMLEQIEGIEDLEYLKKIRQQPLEFRSLDDFLNNY